MSSNFVLLDGGMGKTLEAQGAPFRQPEWSALALIEDPEAVRRAHADFLAAGAEVLTTNNYAVVPFHLGLDRFVALGAELTALAGSLAREVADRGAHGVAGTAALVAGSIPPLYGSYEPENFNPETAPAHLEIIVDALVPFVDVFLVETQSSVIEAAAALRALVDHDIPRWVSFTLADDVAPDAPALRSGEPVAAAVELCATQHVESVLFNCSQPEQMLAAVEQVRSIDRSMVIGVYANAFDNEGKDEGYAANEVILKHRDDLHAAGYQRFVEQWLDAGASIVGGCCGIMPNHIRTLADMLQES